MLFLLKDTAEVFAGEYPNGQIFMKYFYLLEDTVNPHGEKVCQNEVEVTLVK